MNDIRKTIRIYLYSVAILYLSVIVLGIWGFGQNRQRAMEGQQAHKFLCIQEDSLADRITTNTDFLYSPNKAAARARFGSQVISLAKAQLKRDQEALKNLQKTLDCNR